MTHDRTVVGDLFGFAADSTSARIFASLRSTFLMSLTNRFVFMTCLLLAVVAGVVAILKRRTEVSAV
jgi:hypothetical protein